ncbi:hypothetical protein G6F50_015267 [Rhizopus delemar]|uniref:Uncharacterized protein n=1 Tax=Rhizopus delemar TaxID=936053 RepID=A0A9P6XYW3_9FUNG|nr:hypothetical protein G6F50_015267 [Rhizopus delemar]
MARHGEVDLDRTALPVTANGVLQGVFHLRAVKRTFSGGNFEFAAGAAQAFHQRLFGRIPDFVRADALFRTRSDLIQHFGKAEVAIDLLQQGREVGALVLELFFGTENVAVVLREAAHAHHAVQRTRGFVAVALAEFAVAQRQFAVGMQAGIEDLHVARAVHRLQALSQWPVFFHNDRSRICGALTSW